MINHEKWINSLPTNNKKISDDIDELDHERWTNTIPKKHKNNSIQIYSLVAVFFISGLLIVSVIKNKTRNLQKEINNLQASVNLIKFDLDQAILDNEVITSPENISLLAKEYLSIDLVAYQRAQIFELNKESKNSNKIIKTNKESIQKERVKNKNFSSSLKTKVTTRIEEKKEKIKKLQSLYSNPKEIPNEIKTGVASKIEEKKNTLQSIYSSPGDVITYKRVGKWGAMQVVKAFFGLPIIPGR